MASNAIVGATVPTTKIAFIGGGNMSQAILGGLLARGQSPNDCFVIDPDEAARAKLAEWGIAATAVFDERLLLANSIVLAVKPQMMKAALAPLAGRLTIQLVISIAAGVSVDSMAYWLGASGGSERKKYEHIIRTMPNTPALIHAGITGLYAPPGVSLSERAAAENLLTAVGKTVWFESEDMLNAVTAVSGSGPAYVFYLIEALETAAIEMGFSPNDARLFAVETFLGGAKLAALSAESPAELRVKVTSRNGTTERAIKYFESVALKSAFIDGVKAACARSRELGEELGKD